MVGKPARQAAALYCGAQFLGKSTAEVRLLTGFAPPL
jgi:hypothetical protein